MLSLVFSHVAGRKRNLLICNPHSWSVLQSSLLAASSRSSSRCRLVSSHVAGSREKTCRQQSWQPVPAAGNARRDAWPEVPVRVTTRLVHSVTACDNYYLGATSAAWQLADRRRRQYGTDMIATLNWWWGRYELSSFQRLIDKLLYISSGQWGGSWWWGR
jgi:hypothetical protein